MIFLLLLLAGPRGGAQSPSTPPSAAMYLQRGEAALKRNDQNEAAQDFRVALGHDPHNAEAHANLGAIAFFRGDCNAAEIDFRAALQAAPRLTKVQALLSICEHRLGEPEANADMQTAFTQLDDPKLRLQLGMELANEAYQKGDLEGTASILYILLSMDPDNVDVLFFAQRVYSELADDTLNKLAVLSPNSARMEQLVAERLINAGDLPDAIVHYRKAIELGPKLPGLHFELAEALLEGSAHDTGAQKEALSELIAAAQVDGASAKVEAELGQLAVLQGDTAEALIHFQRAYKLDPSDVHAELGLARLYREQEKPAEAAGYLHLAIKTDPMNEKAHYELSQVDRQLHLDEESKRELQLFLDLRASQDKVKLLYREMSPPKVKADSGAPPQ